MDKRDDPSLGVAGTDFRDFDLPLAICALDAHGYNRSDALSRIIHLRSSNNQA
jgi:hypothetical protein